MQSTAFPLCAIITSFSTLDSQQQQSEEADTFLVHLLARLVLDFHCEEHGEVYFTVSNVFAQVLC